MECYSAIKNKHIMKFAGKYHPDPKGHAWYVLSEKWTLAIRYRIPMLQSTDPQKLNKEGTREDA